MRFAKSNLKMEYCLPAGFALLKLLLRSSMKEKLRESEASLGMLENW